MPDSNKMKNRMKKTLLILVLNKTRTHKKKRLLIILTLSQKNLYLLETGLSLRNKVQSYLESVPQTKL
jgi:hypothetical protein